YYRIRLQLRDGDVRYSNIAAVKGYEIDELRLFPNPGAGKVTLTLYSDQAGDAVIKTYDAAGKLAVQQTEALQAGFNTRELNVSRLAGGLYTVKVAMPDKQERTTRLVRQ
ncbi:MAG TPA: T9SS type A sorting domain-containing protein, partial [Flavisolibacter sp.]|nr:T9SS type A sorting domain-containing protein [Flavisolibacter sp.]